MIPETRYSRRTIRTLAVLAFALPIVLYGSQKSIESMLNEPPRWVPPSFPERRQFEQFLREFESQEAVVVSWQGCTIDDDRLVRFAAAARRPTDPVVRKRHADWFERVMTGYEAVRGLMGEPLNLARGEAADRLKGLLVGNDGETSCAVVLLTDSGARQRRMAIEAILDAAQAVCGVDRDQIFVAGPPVEGASIDTAGIRSVQYFAVPSAILSLIICWICLKSWQQTLIVFAAACFGEAMTLAMVFYCGVTMSAVLIVMPPLVFVLTVSAGVHLVNYYRDEVRRRGLEGAADRALAAGWLPCALAAVTSAIGVGSLCVSDITPIRTFGLFSAIGILVSVGLLFLLLPGAFDMWPAVSSRERPVRRDTTPAASPKDLSAADAGTSSVRWAAVVHRGGPWISSVCCLVMIGIGWGLTRIHTSVRLETMFSPQSRIIRDYRWFEDHLGPLVPVEVIVNFDADCPLDMLQRMELVARVHEELSHLEHIGGVVSAVTYAPRLPPPGGARQVAQRVYLRRRLRGQRQRFVDTHFIYETSRRQSWRVSGRASALADVDYGELLGSLRKRLDPYVTTFEGRRLSGVTATYTGVTSLAYKSGHALLHDLFASFMTAFVLVALVMMIVLRGFRAGLVAMMPNVFPTVLLFGAMGWSGRPVDIGSVMTASVALGIAVDDTLHFLAWYRRGIRRGLSRQDAVTLCYSHCARAMMQTTAICGLGLIVYSLSGFVPTSRFAWTMLALLIVALLGDLILLPALLVAPSGRVLGRSSS